MELPAPPPPSEEELKVELKNAHNSNNSQLHQGFQTCHHHSSSHSLCVPSPGKIMRKLSHSKIIVHFPKICEKTGKEAVDLLHNSEEDVQEKKDKNSAYNDEESGLSGPPPQMKKIVKDLPTRLRGLPGGRFLGMILALFASVSISLVTLMVKSMDQYHPFSLVFWRLQGVLWPSVCMMGIVRVGKGQRIFDPVMPIFGKGKWIVGVVLVARGIFGCSADILQYSSLKYLSLADSSVVSFSTPIFVAFVAYFALGEKLGVVPILTGIMSLLGVVIISRPPMLTGEESFDGDILIGNGLAFGCMIMATLTFVSLRSLRHIHFTLSTFSYGFIGTVQSLILCWIVWTFELPHGNHDWILGLSICLLNFVGQLSFTLALQLEEAGPVSLIRTCDVVWAFLGQYVFLGVVPDQFSVIGGSIVITGVLITAMRKFIQELPEDDQRRKVLGFLLK